MDDEFPKTLSSALSIAGKVHGSITDLVKILGDLQADLAGLKPAMDQALAVLKATPATPPGPLPPPKPAVPEGTKAHVATSTPEK